jgi:hypothetical protein
MARNQKPLALKLIERIIWGTTMAIVVFAAYQQFTHK